MMTETIVVKIGTSSLTASSGQLDYHKIHFYAGELAALQREGYHVVLVTSGSIAAGFDKIGYASRPKLFHQRQASAAVGQALLMQMYQEAFATHQIGVGQILLTAHDFSIYDRFSSAKQTIEELLLYQFIPIINENDSVSNYSHTWKEGQIPTESSFVDNDNLAALVAILLRAEKMVIITDTDGLYTGDPRKDPQATHISQVTDIDDDIYKIAGGAGTLVGTGGMRSKIDAAKKAMIGGVSVFIGEVSQDGDLFAAVQHGGKGTHFLSKENNLNLQKQWLGFHSPPQGHLFIDDGAVEALTLHGKSLLPAGIKAVNGKFALGDVVVVSSIHHKVIGRGRVNYSAEQIRDVLGLKTKDALEKIKLRHEVEPKPEVIHRDYWLSLM